jgi:hypothetical protein
MGRMNWDRVSRETLEQEHGVQAFDQQNKLDKSATALLKKRANKKWLKRNSQAIGGRKRP